MINAAADDYVASRSLRLTVEKPRTGDVLTGSALSVSALRLDDIAARLPQVSEPVACRCADALIRSAMMTPELADILVKRQDKAALLVLSEGIGLASETLAQLAETGSAEIARAIAAAPRPSITVLAALLRRNDPVIDRTIAECSGEPLPDDSLALLVHRATKDQRLARLLLSRTDLSTRHRAALYEGAAPRERMAILTLARMHEKDKLHSVNTDLVSEITSAIEAGDAAALTECLASHFDVPYATLYAMLGEPSGATLALALKAMDVPPATIRRACRFASAVHSGLPGGVEDVIETASAASARLIIASMAAAREATISEATADLRHYG
jgi:uncharacterized protein (DUF2336 family)